MVKNLAIVKKFGDKSKFTIARFHCSIETEVPLQNFHSQMCTGSPGVTGPRKEASKQLCSICNGDERGCQLSLLPPLVSRQNRAIDNLSPFALIWHVSPFLFLLLSRLSVQTDDHFAIDKILVCIILLEILVVKFMQFCHS